MSALAARALAPPGPASAQWEALGTTVVLRLADTGRRGPHAAAAPDPDPLPAARDRVEHELDAIDRACSRFRADSELTRVNVAAGGRAVHVGPLLVEALQLALRAAELTGGDVDPTVGAALHLAGYDRDWRLLQASVGPGGAGNAGPGGAANAGQDGAANVIPLRPPPRVRAQLRAGHRTVRLDPVHRTVSLPRGVALDLGATAKAWAADRAARAAHAAVGCGALVSVGGDLATAGPAPAGGWLVHVTDNHRSGPDAPGQTLTIASGGLATSSTTVRRWRRGGAELHHIIDPARGVPARGPWRTVSVAAADCADANIATTAALVRGTGAVAWLRGLGVPARLVAHDGTVLALGGWPSETPQDPQQSPPGRRPGARARIEATTHVDDPQ